ncbi:MAG: aminotransferase class V-fold PLP-dependent enzyme [Acidobacteria bacterium]|nr:aminotransferase class V-fold PLP-dependent enzyme [Acidobacteriota bacterium]
MLMCQKAQFSLPDDEHYLNCAYMSPLSQAVEAAGMSGVRRKRVPARLTPSDFFVEADRARQLFASLVHADPPRIAIVPSASYGLAIAARNLPVARGQRIVVTHEQFPANVHPWRRVAAAQGAELQTVAAPEGSFARGRDWNQRLLEHIVPGTAVVALGHVHWTDGTRFDLEAIGARAREVGAALVIDGTQSIGALPFDVTRVQPDILVTAAYKWLMGPYSLGFAYLGPRLDDGVPLEETWIGRAGSEHFKDLVNYRDDYQPGAVRYDVGERSNFALMPMAIAALEQLLDWTPEAIQAYTRHLTAPLVDTVRALGYTVEDADYRGGHLLGLRVPAAVDVVSVAERLRERRVHVSVRGTAIRVSPHVYNDARDIEALLDALHGARS